MVNSPMALTKGFVLDLTFAKKHQTAEEEKNEDDGAPGHLEWGVRLMEKDILNEFTELTHIIELACDDDEVKRRADTILANPLHSNVYPKYERKIRNTPKPIKLDENGDPIEEEEEELENAEELAAMGLIGNLVEANMISRGCDSVNRFNKEVEHYNMRERNIFDEYIVKLYESTYFKIEIAGMTPDELT